MNYWDWETEVYPQMHAEATAAGKQAREEGLPRECNLIDPEFIHNGEPLRLWKKIWEQGYDGWSIPPIFQQMERVLNKMPMKRI